MAKKKTSGKVSTAKEIGDTANRLMKNSALQDAVLGFNPGGPGVQLSQVTTIFYNMRWYLISNMRQPLNEAYCEIGVIKTVVDVPVEDAFRGGVLFHSKQMSPDELEELHYTFEQEGDIDVSKYAHKWDRLFGGAGIIIVTDDDPSMPLKPEDLEQGAKLSFKDADMWELFWDKENITGDGEPIETPQSDYYRYYGKNVHKSRVLILRGIRAPSFIRPRLRGWGLSVVEILVRSVNQYLKATDLTFEVLDEFKIDVYKIKNLTDTLMSAEGVSAVHNRIRVANLEKNFQNAITMDAEDDFTQKELSFQGIAETMVGIRMQIASDLRMPLTKVFGISAQGFSSGEDDIENYNAMVESSIRGPALKHLVTMGKLRCQTLFGYIPDDLMVEFKPLRILSSEQQENVKNAQFQRALSALQAGLMSQKEFKDAVNKDKLLPIALDTSLDTVSDKLEQEAEAAPKPGDGGEAKKAGPASTKVTKEPKS